MTDTTAGEGVIVSRAWLESVRSAATTLSGEHHAMTEGQRKSLMSIAVEAKSIAAQPSAGAQGEAVAWRSADEAPTIPRGTAKTFVVTVFRGHSGRPYTFAAEYLNAMELDWDEDGDTRLATKTGWFMEIGEDQDFYRPVTIGKDDRFLGWTDLPKWSDASSDTTPAQPDTGEPDPYVERMSAEADAKLVGTGFMVDGRRVCPNRIKIIGASEEQPDTGDAEIVAEYLRFVMKTLPRDEADLASRIDQLSKECAGRLAKPHPDTGDAEIVAVLGSKHTTSDGVCQCIRCYCLVQWRAAM